MKNLDRSIMVMSAILTSLMERGFQDGMFGIDDVELEDQDSKFFAPTFKWLISEGIVRATRVMETADSFDILNPMLTSSGLQMLGQQLEIDGNSVSLSDVIREPAQVAGKMSAIGELFGGFTMGAIKASG